MGISASITAGHGSRDSYLSGMTNANGDCDWPGCLSWNPGKLNSRVSSADGKTTPTCRLELNECSGGRGFGCGRQVCGANSESFVNEPLALTRLMGVRPLVVDDKAVPLAREGTKGGNFTADIGG